MTKDRFGNEIELGDIIRIRKPGYRCDEQGQFKRCWDYTNGRVFRIGDKSVHYIYTMPVFGEPGYTKSRQTEIAPEQLVSLSALKRKGVFMDNLINPDGGPLW